MPLCTINRWGSGTCNTKTNTGSLEVRLAEMVQLRNNQDIKQVIPPISTLTTKK